MRRPHVFQRSAPRGGRHAVHDLADPQATSRVIAIQLGSMIDKATAAGLGPLADCLELARIEAEKSVA